MKKSAAELEADLKAHVDFLAEAGAGFVLRGAEADAPPTAGQSPGCVFARGGRARDARRGARRRRPPNGKPSRRSTARSWPARSAPSTSRRTNAVPGEGDRSAALMFVGEAPGRDEDAQGRPFVGRAGQLLRKIIAAMNFREDEVYITNIVKCRPPDNRVPLREEEEACSPYLVRQIELIRPRVIVTLGKTPTDYFAPGRESMTARRGRFGDYRGIPVMPTFHPSYLVRNEGNRELKRMVWEDMQKVMALLGGK